MRPAALTSRSIWWAFAAGGAAALVAGGFTGLGLVEAPLATGAWQLPTGILVLVAVLRSPAGFAAAFPFLGAWAAGIILGLAGVLPPALGLPALEPRIALIAIGIWGVVAGAGYLAVARLARAYHVPDGGLLNLAWVAIAVGAAISTLPAFGLGGAPAALAAVTVITGAITVAASLRLRVLPDEAPPVLSHREEKRRERAERRP
jgi:hypothetical protein